VSAIATAQKVKKALKNSTKDPPLITGRIKIILHKNKVADKFKRK